MGELREEIYAAQCRDIGIGSDGIDWLWCVRRSCRDGWANGFRDAHSESGEAVQQ